jgi:cell shape-determining protein MreD
MGTLETPVILTNTLGIGTAADALICYMLDHNPDIGSTTAAGPYILWLIFWIIMLPGRVKMRTTLHCAIHIQ